MTYDRIANGSFRQRIYAGVVAAILATLGATPALAQSQPIKSAQDAACRDEARDRVFTAPDPQGLGFYTLGRQLYNSCMQRRSAGGRAGRTRIARDRRR